MSPVGAIASNGELSLKQVNIVGSSADQGGGGIHVGKGGALVMKDSSIRDCHTNQMGGGVDVDDGDLDLIGIVLEGNMAAQGGSIAAKGEGSMIKIKQGAITGNTGVEMAGGIYVMEGQLLLQVTWSPRFVPSCVCLQRAACVEYEHSCWQRCTFVSLSRLVYFGQRHQPLCD